MPAARTTITWTAAAHGGALRLEYQFIRYSPALAHGRWSGSESRPRLGESNHPRRSGRNIVIVAVKSWGGDGLEATRRCTWESDLPPNPMCWPPGHRMNFPHGQQVFFGPVSGSVAASTTDGLQINAGRRLSEAYTYTWMRAPDGGVPGVGLHRMPNGVMPTAPQVSRR